MASSKAAIAVATQFKQVLIFANEKVRSVKTPTVENIQELMVVGGKANLEGVLRVSESNSSKDFEVNLLQYMLIIFFLFYVLNLGMDKELKIVVRTESGIIFVWFDTLKQYIR